MIRGNVVSGHAIRSKVLGRRPIGHRWAWFCSCGWSLTSARAESLYLFYENHLGVVR